MTEAQPVQTAQNKLKLPDTKPVETKIEEKIRVKFAACTMIITNAEEFKSKLKGVDKDNFMFYPDPTSYKHFTVGQVVDLTQAEYAQVKDRTVLVNNERMGKLGKLYEERMANATPSEKEYIEKNREEFQLCQFERPLVEVLH